MKTVIHLEIFSDTPFALVTDKDKVTIEIVESANVGELKIPIWDPIKVIELSRENDIDSLKDEFDLLDPDAAFCEGPHDNSDIDVDGISEPPKGE